MTAKSLKHKFVSGIADGADTSVVRPSNWNDTHDHYLDVNAQTGNYGIAASDSGALITFKSSAAVAVTLPQASNSAITPGTLGFFNGWFCFVRNLGVGLVTITPSTSTIDGFASITLPTGHGGLIVSDGTNYQFVWMAPESYREQLLINGGFDIWQRGTSFTTGAAQYGPDRWKLQLDDASATWTVSRQAADAQSGTNFKCRLQRNNAANNTSPMKFYMALETVDSLKMAGPITLSYYAKAAANCSPTSGALQSRIATGKGTDQSADSLIAAGWTSQLTDVQTDNITATRTRVSHTFAVPGDVTQIGIWFRRCLLARRPPPTTSSTSTASSSRSGRRQRIMCRR